MSQQKRFLFNMGKIFLLTFFALMSVCKGGIYANSKDCSIMENSSVQKVYYIVLGSYNTLESAQTYNYNCSDGMECWIYKCTSKDKTVYRVCFDCFSTSQKAQIEINKWRSYGISWFTDAWIWESDGLGNCVYCPINYETEKPKQPLSPK